MARFRVGRGSAQVRVNDELEALLNRLIDEQFKDFADALEAEVRDVYDRAHKAWPVSSGASRDALSVAFEFRPPDRIVGRIYIDPHAPGRRPQTGMPSDRAVRPVTYVPLVEAKKLRYRNPWEVLVRQPALNRAAAFRERLATAVRVRGTRATRRRGRR